MNFSFQFSQNMNMIEFWSVSFVFLLFFFILLVKSAKDHVFKVTAIAVLGLAGIVFSTVECWNPNMLSRPSVDTTAMTQAIQNTYKVDGVDFVQNVDRTTWSMTITPTSDHKAHACTFRQLHDEQVVSHTTFPHALRTVYEVSGQLNCDITTSPFVLQHR